MNKENLVKKISKKAGIKKKDCSNIFDKVIQLIIKDLKKGKNVNIDNFGEFRIIREEMKVLIKNNKSKIVIPPKDIVIFEPDKNLISY
ncbi:MAG: HU family DNA-binding protein [Bacteroidota bacterium]|nr:HU family DNA-binding protein [Bacteroidota bacterium]